jgi:hypothetical protein
VAGNKNSQYDPGLIVKEVHDFHGQFIRTADATAINSGYFTHFSVVYNGDNNPTQVTYFRGETSHITKIGCIADVSGSLNNTYFKLYSAPANKAFHVWFNVDGGGTAPVVANSTAIEVEISQNDPAIVVATALSLTIAALFSRYFTTSRTGAAVELRTVGFGICSNTVDFGTGFVFSNTQGTQVKTAELLIDYVGLDPVYNGQLLKDYHYDVYSGKFEKNAISSSSATNVVVQNRLFTKPYNKLSVLSKNDDGNPLQVESYLAGVPKQLATIQYDSDGDFLDVEVSDL